MGSKAFAPDFRGRLAGMAGDGYVPQQRAADPKTRLGWHALQPATGPEAGRGNGLGPLRNTSEAPLQWQKQVAMRQRTPPHYEICTACKISGYHADRMGTFRV